MPRTSDSKTTTKRRRKSSNEPKKRKRRPREQKVTTPAPVAAPPVTTPPGGAETAKKTTKRGRPTREEILSQFQNVMDYVDTTLSNLKVQSSDAQTTSNVKSALRSNSKVLREVKKQLGKVRNSAKRAIRSKTRTTTRSVNSGFMKPVNISPEMSKFARWGASEKHSRVEVTKVLCSYIKDHNLQNPSDRRQIIPDTKLRKLLRLENSTTPLTYYTLQRVIQCHFPSSN